MKPFMVLGLDGASTGMRAMLSSAGSISGLWGEKIGDDVLWDGAKNILPLGFKKKFVDLKHYDTKDRLKRIVAGYAALEHPPALLSISGELKDVEPYKELVSVKKDIGLLLTGPLSDWDDKFCVDKYSMTAAEWMDHVVVMAIESGADGVTCPAKLLEDDNLRSFLIDIKKADDFVILATGIRSEGIPPGNHIDPRTPAFAMKHGATLVVIESEVTSLPEREPLAQLERIYNSVVKECEPA